MLILTHVPFAKFTSIDGRLRKVADLCAPTLASQASFLLSKTLAGRITVIRAT